MVTHTVLVKERHLLLNCSVNAWITGVKAHYKESAVIEILHQGKLLFQIHIGR